MHVQKEPNIMGAGRQISHEPAGGRPAESDDPVDDRPRSVYELMTRQMLEEVKHDIAEVKGRINTLLWMLAGAVVMELVMRLVK